MRRRLPIAPVVRWNSLIAARSIPRGGASATVIANGHAAGNPVAMRPIARVIDVGAAVIVVVGLDIDVVGAVLHPTAANPNPLIAVPVPVAVDPHIAVAGRGRDLFIKWLGRITFHVQRCGAAHGDRTRGIAGASAGRGVPARGATLSDDAARRRQRKAEAGKSEKRDQMSLRSHSRSSMHAVLTAPEQRRFNCIVQRKRTRKNSGSLRSARTPRGGRIAVDALPLP